MIKVSLINLGCAKNLVDSESILGLFKDDDRFLITTDLNEADIIILNTCAFIFDAEEESLATIEEILTYKKKTIVLGCLVEKYKEALQKRFKGIDCFVGFKQFVHLPEIISSLLNEDINKEFCVFNRLMDENTHSIYLKISEGCNHRCGYCIIPKLRGDYYSYKLDDLVEYTKKVVKEGVKEVTLIAQDTTYYGRDFDNGDNLEKLLLELDKIEGIEFLRVLYLYPSEVKPSLIEVIKNSKHIVPYFDLPIQHASDPILKAMNRTDTEESLLNLINHIRKEIPNAILRATLIVGYPGEIEKDIGVLQGFLEKTRIHHVGCFTFSNEKLAPAYKLKNHVPEEAKLERKTQIMNFQRHISYSLNKELIGRTEKGIIIEKRRNDYLVRTSFNAPDDIDGKVILKTDIEHEVGDIIYIRYIDAYVYDLIGEEVRKIND